ncbi:hypothetical protein ABZY09_48530 [Streptomyces sp. NPDC002928]|uniref:hypothetical protein n=1 Tax=Streptomyces sp. NPDC002928 TaxID=3154440 RepID=UPI0033AB9140
MPYIAVEFIGREEIRAAIERLQDDWEYFVQTLLPGTIRIEGNTAVGRNYVAEFGRMRDGSSHLNYSLCTTATCAPRAAGSSPSAATRSGASTPLRWRVRRPTRRPGHLCES